MATPGDEKPGTSVMLSIDSNTMDRKQCFKRSDFVSLSAVLVDLDFYPTILSTPLRGVI